MRHAGKTAAPAATAALALALCVPRAAATGVPMPFPRLYDTRAASARPLPAAALAKRAGWAAVAEGNTAHRFAGDAVLANDKLALAIRRRGDGAELYVRAAAGWQRQGTLSPRSAPGGPAGKLASLRVAASAPAAVELAVSYHAPSHRPAGGVFRLTTGVPFVEFRPGPGAAAVQVRDAIRHVVVPELLADDLVVDPAGLTAERTGIPAENLLLTLLGGGEAIGVCVWKSNERSADALSAGSGGRREIAACEIECAKGESVWYAVLASPGLWYAHTVAPGEAGRKLRLDWRPPFGAKWRCGLVFPSGAPASRDLDAARAWVQLAGEATDANTATRPAPKVPAPRRLVVYPIDRSRQTPLTVFCPIDVMRNTLGVGVCRYVLEVEGLGSEGGATPKETADWLERTFKRKRDKARAEQIKQRLAAMAGCIRAAEARTDEYYAAFRRLSGICKQGQASASPQTVRAARRVGELVPVEAAASSVLAAQPAVPEMTPQTVAVLSGRIIGLIGKGGAAAEVRKIASVLRGIGRAQDAALCDARMVLRRVKQRCRDLARSHGEAAGFLAKVRAEAERMLRKKTPAKTGAKGDGR